MTIMFHLDEHEPFANIGIAKALIENDALTPDDLYEISCYLKVYYMTRNGDKNDFA